MHRPERAVPRGLHDPLPQTPSLTGRVLRRSTTVDILRPEGLRGPAVIEGRGRDLVTVPGTEPRVAATASLGLETPSLNDATIGRISADPAPPELTSLVGAAASAGFRARLPEVLRDEPAGSLTWRLATEVPNLYVIGGFAMQYERVPLGTKAPLMLTQAGVCAGWQEGGSMLSGIAADGMVPHMIGPDAPSVDVPGEPHAWHDAPPLAPHGVRRRRRVDVFAPAPGAPLFVDVWFRDTFQPPDGPEMVIHEYTLGVSVDGDPATITGIDVTARVLPWMECPTAAASATRMVGEPLRSVAARARRELHGIETCTHLNACVASLADLDVLLPVAVRAGTPARS